MANWRLVLQYDGAAFAGWQLQPGQRTVQGELETALGQLFDVPRVVVHASGRTDAGVHALGQVVSFQAEKVRVPERVRLGLNTMLPPEMSVVEAAHAPDGFHARSSALGKTYRYRVLARADRSPFERGRALHVRETLDWTAVEAALPALVGEHDFSAFRGAGCSAKSPVRRIDRAVHRLEGGETAGVHLIEFHGSGFLRYQVRKMVGTLLEVARGRRSPEDVAAVLSSRDPRRCGKTALPCGLYLVSVDYGA